MERNSLFSTRSRQTISVLVFVATLLTSSPSVLTPHALAQSPPVVSMNMTSGNTTSTSNNNPNATTTATPELGNKKTFYVFSEEMEGVNETKLGIPGDVYAPSVLAANEGDTVTIHFYNLDPSDRHTFTMAAPYNINKDVGPLENTTITFKANDPGVYRFYCTYHQPTMSGQVIVLPPPTVEKAAPAYSAVSNN
jgi:plastocyanin